jgi:hypothetical protein
MGGKHVEAQQFRLMVTGTEICPMSANFMASGSRFQQRVCAV